MSAFLQNRIHRTWLLLIVATLATFWLREDGFASAAAGVATISIAYGKGRFVILDFMEMRGAPRLWRGIVEGWLLAVSAVLLSVYCLGLSIA